MRSAKLLVEGSTLASGGKGNAQLAQFVVMVLFVKNIPLFPALGDRPLLGGYALANNDVYLRFFDLKIIEDFENFLTDSIAFLEDFHLIERVDGGHHLVRKLEYFFARHGHKD